MAKKSQFFGATASEARKVKKWKFVEKTMSAGELLRLIDDLEAKGYIGKCTPIYRATMVYVNLDRYLELHPEKRAKYQKAGAV